MAFPSMDLIAFFRSSIVLTLLVGSMQAIALSEVAVSEDSAATPARKLQVLPSQVVVTPEYPAVLSVWYVTEQGQSMDVSRDPNLVIRGFDPAVAHFSEGWVRGIEPGTLDVTVEYAGLSDKVHVVSEVDLPLTYTREIAATLTRSGCNLGTCHGNLHGKGGFRLSLRGDDPLFDHYRLAYEYGQRRIDCWEPESSLLLLKATASIPHQGGKRFSDDDPEYRWLRRWIAEGAPESHGPELVSLNAFPKSLRLAHGQQEARVLVHAEFTDGSIRDVTRWCRIEPSLPSGVRVSPDGLVVADRPLDVSLGITYLTGRAAAHLVFLGPGSEESTASITVNNPIDGFIQSHCRELQIAQAGRVDDWTLVRRLYLATVGRLPTPEESIGFVESNEPTRVERLVDELLADPGFDYAWALRWSDLLRNEDKVMSSRGAASFHDWLRQQSALDRSVRDWVGELVSSVGSTYDNPPASFHRTHRDPFVTAESTAQVFLGVRLACAKCHNHPFDSWRQDDYYGLAAYFTTVERQQIDNKPKDALDKHIITGDEIISLAQRPPQIKHPGRSKMVGPSPLSQPTNPLSQPTNSAQRDPNSDDNQVDGEQVLERFANWLTHDNAQFDANIANRIWYQYFGRGIVDPPDDFRSSNPPSNPELLAYLSQSFRDSNHSIKTLSRLILTSDTFARRSMNDGDQLDALNPVPYFASFPVRRLGAEVLMDAISNVTGVAAKFQVESDEGTILVHQAMRMPGIPKKSGFLTAFGKPNRLLDCECERTNAVSLAQSLALVNGKEVRERLTARGNRIDGLLSSQMESEGMIRSLFLTTLCRPPHASELQASVALLEEAPSPRDGMQDVLWALINSKEFALMR